MPILSSLFLRGFLLQTLESQPGEMQTKIIVAALTKVRNPEAISSLAARLQEDLGLFDPTSRIAGDTLAAMGRPEAIDVLLQWAAMDRDAKSFIETSELHKYFKYQ
jgi:hypothetical protein